MINQLDSWEGRLKTFLKVETDKTEVFGRESNVVNNRRITSFIRSLLLSRDEELVRIVNKEIEDAKVSDGMFLDDVPPELVKDMDLVRKMVNAILDHLKTLVQEVIKSRLNN